MPISGSTSGQTRRVVIRSVGTAAAGVVGALRQALPFAEERLAACIYQAPAELLGHLDQTTAEALARALMTMGLEVETLGPSETFTPGGPDYDVALAIQGTDRLLDAAREIATFLGVPFMQARQILCACPTELIGKVSANTVAAIRRRFEPLGVAVDVSRREGAVFDLFVGDCPPPQQAEVQRCLREAGLLTGDAGEAGDALRPRVLAGLREPDAKACYERLKGCRAPIRIVNRDFQRFDVRLEEARDTLAMVEFLVESTGMPEAVAKKVPARTPIVIQHNLPYRETQEALARIAGLGGGPRPTCWRCKMSACSLPRSATPIPPPVCWRCWAASSRSGRGRWCASGACWITRRRCPRPGGCSTNCGVWAPTPGWWWHERRTSRGSSVRGAGVGDRPPCISGSPNRASCTPWKGGTTTPWFITGRRSV